MQFIKDVSSNEAAAISNAWRSLLDPNAIFKLLYCLQIILQQFINVSLPSRDEELYDDDMNNEFAENLKAYEQQRIWKEEFI